MLVYLDEIACHFCEQSGTRVRFIFLIFYYYFFHFFLSLIFFSFSFLSLFPSSLRRSIMIFSLPSFLGRLIFSFYLSFLVSSSNLFLFFIGILQNAGPRNITTLPDALHPPSPPTSKKRKKKKSIIVLILFLLYHYYYYLSHFIIFFSFIEHPENNKTDSLNTQISRLKIHLQIGKPQGLYRDPSAPK